LRSSRNLLIALPQHSPPGIETAMGRRVCDDALWRWRTVRGSGMDVGSAAPIRDLFQGLDLDPPGPGEPWEDCLADAAEMQDRVLWIAGIQADNWSAWSGALIRYAKACQPRPQFGRGLICCCVCGIPSAKLPVTDGALSVHTWTGRLDELDLQIWAAHDLRGMEMSPLQRRARRVLAATLAGFDPDLAMHLARLDLATLANPESTLKKFAAERGWMGSEPCPPVWHLGTADSVGGEHQTHLALSVLSGEGGRRQVALRVWQAQVTLLFPLIEQRRGQIIADYRGSLIVPFEKGDGTWVTQIEDLEIAHLYFQLRNHRDRRIEPLLRRLREARNALAHLEPLSGVEFADVLQALGG
jgi:hypothetical protein